jgi:hypothetical protein
MSFLKKVSSQLEKAESDLNRGNKAKLYLKVEIQRLEADHGNWNTDERREQIEKARKLAAFQGNWYRKKKKLVDEIDNVQAEYRLFELGDRAIEKVQSQIKDNEQEIVDARTAFEHECAATVRDSKASEKVHNEIMRGIEGEVKEARIIALKQEKAATQKAARQSNLRLRFSSRTYEKNLKRQNFKRTTTAAPCCLDTCEFCGPFKRRNKEFTADSSASGRDSKKRSRTGNSTLRRSKKKFGRKRAF